MCSGEATNDYDFGDGNGTDIDDYNDDDDHVTCDDSTATDDKSTEEGETMVGNSLSTEQMTPSTEGSGDSTTTPMPESSTISSSEESGEQSPRTQSTAETTTPNIETTTDLGTSSSSIITIIASLQFEITLTQGVLGSPVVVVVDNSDVVVEASVVDDEVSGVLVDGSVVVSSDVVVSCSVVVVSSDVVVSSVEEFSVDMVFSVVVIS
uniref:Uncharacterized protein n=1 Tax=Megaselia scalaris TaxID=36166 RepID=T1GR65_MEGSC